MSLTKEQREIIARYSKPGGTGADEGYAQRDGIILAIAELIEEVRGLRRDLQNIRPAVGQIDVRSLGLGNYPPRPKRRPRSPQPVLRGNPWSKSNDRAHS